MSKRDEFLDVARSQLGYVEGTNNDTKYGEWYGMNYNPWCAMFCSWCINEIDMLDIAFPKFAGCTTGFNQMSRDPWNITTKEHIIPTPGDLIFFEWDGDPDDYDHVGIVESTDGVNVDTIEGNHDDCVDRYTYPLDSMFIVGYAKPKFGDIPPAPPTKNQVQEFQAWLNTFDNVSIAEDGIYGKYTKKASVIALQTLLRDEYNQDISIDGIFGNETWNACHCVALVQGDDNNMVKLVKGTLICNNFTPLALSTDFDPAMWHKVKDYQCYHGLEEDGIVGVEVLTEMFS